MASGSACLACACPTGPEEIVRHGVDGWLLPGEASAAELAGGLEPLLADGALRERLGAAALAVRERYGPGRFAASSSTPSNPCCPAECLPPPPLPNLPCPPPSAGPGDDLWIVLPHLGPGGAQKVAVLAASHFATRGCGCA